MGTVQMHVPSSKREVLASRDCESWLAADRKALNVILMQPGNRLVPESVPLNKGLPVARTVTQRRIKVEQSTGKLADHNPFKSRHCLDGGHYEQQLKAAHRRNGTEEDTAISTSSVSDDLTVKLTFGHTAVEDNDLTKGDVGNAYAKGKRTRREAAYMDLPATCLETAEDGSRLVLEITTPIWGETSAGYEWECAFNAELHTIGWRPVEAVPGMFTHDSTHGTAILLTVVDDFLISEPKSAKHSISDATIKLLRKRFGDVTAEREPASFVGYKITRDRQRRALTINMPQKVIEATREHLPQLVDNGTAPALPKGRKLQKMADALQLAERTNGARLTKQQVTTQRIIGSLKFVEKVMPKLTLPLHRLSCVMSSPPPEALIVAQAALALAYKDRHLGITYGGDGPATAARFKGRLAANILLDEPAGPDLECAADATWCERNLYGLLLTYARGSVLHQTKKIGILTDSSTESEAMGSAKAAEMINCARNVLRAINKLGDEPTPLLTDNQANALIAANATSASRARHFLRRYHVLQQRIASGEVNVYKIDDPNMPADFLTKWLDAGKLNISIEYATNQRAAVAARHGSSETI
jgi:hypothetical protein